MKSMRHFLALFFVGVCLMLSAQVTISGATFQKKMDIKGEMVNYNGAGIRNKYGMNLYVSALYLPSQSSDFNKIINANEVQVINIKIISSMVTREKFNESVKEGFAKASHGKATSEQMAAFKAFFSAEIKNKDDILLIYRPNVGVQVMINGSFKGKVEGLEFKKALWSIWLGNAPADVKLKKKMLGLS